ncbi:MAG: hypothetical protein DMD81_02690 [Candidatus Rokuibacteriota bacterium]|nr:MAG: hypothetical protein DMD81_02690 [Candidatus Rokubacteria bacterium]
MKRFSVLIAVATLFTAGPALAFQCPKLVNEIRDKVGNRMDNTANDAKAKADEAEKLHKDGKHAEAEKLAKDTLAALGQ